MKGLVKLTEAISSASGNIDKLTSVHDVANKTGIISDEEASPLKEAAAVASLAINVISAPFINADLTVYEGTKAAQIKSAFSELETHSGITGEAARALGKVKDINRAKNNFLASPLFSAATTITITGALSGGMAVPLVVGGIAVETAVAAKNINDIYVLRDEYFHLKDFVDSKEIKKDTLEELTLELRKRTGKDNELNIEQILGITPPPISPENPKLEPLLDNDGKKKFGQALILKVGSVAASNVLSAGALMAQGPVGVVVNIAQLASSTALSTVLEMSEIEVKNDFLKGINELRKEGPPYQTHKEAPSRISSYLFKFKSSLNKMLGKDPPPNPSNASISRKYDLASFAIKEKTQASALEALTHNEEFQDNLAKLSTTKQGTKEYDQIATDLRTVYLAAKGSALDEIRKSPFYQNEQISKPTTKLETVTKSFSTIVTTVTRYFHPTKEASSLSGAMEEAQGALAVSGATKDKVHAKLLQKRTELKEKEAELEAKTREELSKKQTKPTFFQKIKNLFSTNDSKKKAHISETLQEDLLMPTPKPLVQDTKKTKDIERQKIQELLAILEDQKISKTEKIKYIETHCNAENLKISVKQNDGKEVSIIEYAAQNNLGSKIISSLLNKADINTFSLQQLQSSHDIAETNKSKSYPLSKSRSRAIHTRDSIDQFISKMEAGRALISDVSTVTPSSVTQSLQKTKTKTKSHN